MNRWRLPLAALLVSALAATAPAGWWEDAAKPREPDVSEILAAPARWRDVPVSIVVRFARRTDAVSADTTTGVGTPTDWVAFAASSTTATADLPVRFVVRAGSAEAARLATLGPREEIRIRALVRDDIPAPPGATSPTLEVVRIAGPSDALTPEELGSLRRADEMLAKDNAAAAEAALIAVLTGRTLSPAIRAELLRRIARTLKAQDRLDDAARALREVARLAPDDLAAAADAARIEAAASAKPRTLRTAAPPDGTSARDARPFPQAPVIAGPDSRADVPRDANARAAANVPAPAASRRLAPLRDRDGEAVPASTPTASSPAVPHPPQPPPVEDLPVPAPRLAPPR